MGEGRRKGSPGLENRYKEAYRVYERCKDKGEWKNKRRELAETYSVTEKTIWRWVKEDRRLLG